VPKSEYIAPVTTQKPIAVVKKRVIPIQVSGDIISGNCRANGKSLSFNLSPKKTEEIFMDYEAAIKLLRSNDIEINDFESGAKALKPDDGSIIENAVLYLRELAIGDDYAENVKVIVKKGLPTTFVICADFIKEEWGEYTIDSEKKEIVFEK